MNDESADSRLLEWLPAYYTKADRIFLRL